MKSIQITHKKAACIGCALCTEVAPGYWQMDTQGEAQLTQPIRRHGSFEYAQGFEDDRAALVQAVRGCPVGIIRIA
jgi:ferredoxin